MEFDCFDEKDIKERKSKIKEEIRKLDSSSAVVIYDIFSERKTGWSKKKISKKLYVEESGKI